MKVAVGHSQMPVEMVVLLCSKAECVCTLTHTRMPTDVKVLGVKM